LLKYILNKKPHDLTRWWRGGGLVQTIFSIYTGVYVYIQYYYMNVSVESIKGTLRFILPVIVM